jgi:T5orf172 domain-containing protein
MIRQDDGDPFAAGFVRIDGWDYPLSFAPHGYVAGGLERGGLVRDLYIIAANGFDDRAKVGIADDAEKRRYGLQGGSSVELTIYRSYRIDRAAAEWMEGLAHHTLAHCRLHSEWFGCAPEEALKAVDAAMAYHPVHRRFRIQNLHDHPQWKAAVKARKLARAEAA